MNTKGRLTDQEKTEWLKYNIPHRVRAAIARTDLEKKLLNSTNFDSFQKDIMDRNEKIIRRCETDSIWEGRRVAIRWLIEFVGVKSKDKDIGITDLDGKLFDPHSDKAQKLAGVWKRSSQATCHPTQTGNPELEANEIGETLEIIMGHLDEQLYKKIGQRISEEALQPPPA